MLTQDRGLKFYNNARAYFERKQWDEAIENYDKVISSSNKKLHALAHYNKGLSLLNSKKIGEGLTSIQQAIAHDSKLKEPGNKVIAEIYRRLRR